VELVSIQVVAVGLRAGGGVPERVVVSRPELSPSPPREAYFGRGRGWMKTPVIRRSDLSARRAGPLIVEEYDSTCVIPPDAYAELDAGGNIAIDL
jgi:N-methylhydantoinase A